MTDACCSRMTSPDDAELLRRYPARASGTLSEVAAVCRCALPFAEQFLVTFTTSLTFSPITTGTHAWSPDGWRECPFYMGSATRTEMRAGIRHAEPSAPSESVSA